MNARAAELDRPRQWRARIAARLIGGMFRHRASERLDRPASAPTPCAPVFRWWLFDGHAPALLGGPLGQSWPQLQRQVDRLLQTHNPRLRASDRPEGDVDWPRTLAQGPRARRRYIVRSSRTGLSDPERAALVGWLGWLLAEWHHYTLAWATPDNPRNHRPLAHLRRLAGPTAPTLRALHRWAATATRARWPLFRHLIAPTLRARLEGLTLESLPLPAERHRLFELFVLVELASALGEEDGEVRWFGRRSMDAGLGGEARFGRVGVTWQHSLDRGAVWAAATAEGFGRAAERFGLRCHNDVDLLFDLSEVPGARFETVAVEVKSGEQHWREGQWQVWSYGRALAKTGGRCLAWGVSEGGGEHGAGVVERWLGEDGAEGEPVWLFSGVGDVGRVGRWVVTSDVETD